MSAPLAPDPALERLMTTSLAACDALNRAAHDLLQLPPGVAPDDVRAHAREWLTTLGPNVFATVPQAAINLANRIILAARAANGLNEAALRALLDSVMTTLNAQYVALVDARKAIEAFHAGVARDAGANPSGAASRFSEATSRLAETLGAVVQSWHRSTEGMLTAIEDASAEDLMKAMPEWEIIRAVATTLQQSSLRG